MSHRILQAGFAALLTLDCLSPCPSIEDSAERAPGSTSLAGHRAFVYHVALAGGGRANSTFPYPADRILSLR